jgi:outer membrane protein
LIYKSNRSAIFIKMKIKKKGYSKTIIFFGVSLCMSGCDHPLPEINPYFYAPKSSSNRWTPSREQIAKEAKVPEIDNYLLPNKERAVSLAELINVALANNPNTSIAWYQARSAAAAYGISRADYYPSVNFTADVTTYSQSLVLQGSSPVTQTFTTAGPTATLNYVLFDFGMRSAQAEEMLQTLENANFTFNEMLQQIMQQVADDYYGYMYQYANLEAQFANLNDAKITLDAAMQRLEQGVANLSEMLQARTQFLQRQVDVASQEGVVKNSFVQLLSALGLPSDVTFQIGSFPSDPRLERFSLNSEELLAMAKEARPSIAAARANVLTSQAALDYARAAPLPVFNAMGSVGNRWYATGQWDKGDYVGQINVQFPLFAGFMYRNQIREAEQNLKTAIFSLQSEELQVSEQVMTYYNDFTVAQKEVKYTRLYLESAEEEFQVVLSNYEMGVNTILDVLSAQASLADARAKFISAKRDLYVAMVNVSFAVGKLTKENIANPEEGIDEKSESFNHDGSALDGMREAGAKAREANSCG